MIIMAIIANKKGFNPLLWILASGFLGFIILLCMPSANAVGIDDETSDRRRSSGNQTGDILSVVAVMLIVVVFAILSNS